MLICCFCYPTSTFLLLKSPIFLQDAPKPYSVSVARLGLPHHTHIPCWACDPIRGNLEILTGTVRENRLPFHWGITETRLKPVCLSSLPIHGKILPIWSEQKSKQSLGKGRTLMASTEHLDPADSEAGLHFTPLRLFNYVNQKICSLCLHPFELVFCYLTAMIHRRRMLFLLHSVSFSQHTLLVW